MAHLPHYAQLDEDFAGTSRMLEVLSAFYDVPVNLVPTHRGKLQYAEIDAAVERKPENKALVSRLEAYYDSTLSRPRPEGASRHAGGPADALAGDRALPERPRPRHVVGLGARWVLLEVRLDGVEVTPRDGLQHLGLAKSGSIVRIRHKQRFADDAGHVAGPLDGRALRAEQVVVATLPQDPAVGRWRPRSAVW